MTVLLSLLHEQPVYSQSLLALASYISTLAAAAGSASSCSAAKLSGVRFVARTASAMPAARSCLTFLRIVCFSPKEGLSVGKGQFICRRVPCPAAALRNKSSTFTPPPTTVKASKFPLQISATSSIFFTMQQQKCNNLCNKKRLPCPETQQSFLDFGKMRRGAYSSLSSSSSSSSSSLLGL